MSVAGPAHVLLKGVPGSRRGWPGRRNSQGGRLVYRPTYRKGLWIGQGLGCGSLALGLRPGWSRSVGLGMYVAGVGWGQQQGHLGRCR